MMVAQQCQSDDGSSRAASQLRISPAVAVERRNTVGEGAVARQFELSFLMNEQPLGEAPWSQE
jgi:hypothetical protein